MNKPKKKSDAMSIRISMKAYRALSARAKKERRTIVATLELLLGV